MNWRVSDVIDSEQYRLHLCQSPNGNRYFRLVAVGSEFETNRTNDVVFVTHIVPNSLIKSRNMKAISKSVLLDNGTSFSIDAHGMWLAEEERIQLNAGVNFEQINWATECAPEFAPK